MDVEIVAILVIAVVLLWVIARRRGEATRMAVGSGHAPGSLDDALARGRKIDAIKIYRAEHGVGLQEAKDAVEERARVLAARSGS
jgi:ribosomal protein L7/L12